MAVPSKAQGFQEPSHHSLKKKTNQKTHSGPTKTFHIEHLQPEKPFKVVTLSEPGHSLQLIIHLINFASFSL